MDSGQWVGEPARLQRPMVCEDLDPPVETREQHLPFEALSWENFEHLNLRIARMRGEVQHSADYVPEDSPRSSMSQREVVTAGLYGKRGQDQEGIDLYVRLPDDGSAKRSYLSLQSRRIAKLTPAKLREAVTDFLRGNWAEVSKIFVYSVSVSAAEKRVVDEVRVQRERLSALGIEFEVWDAEQLSLLLKHKNYAGLVDEFFGRAWAERFLPTRLVSKLESREIEGKIRESVKAPFMAPRMPPTFVERPDIGSALLRALGEQASKSDNLKLVVMTGSGGFGKTTLAGWVCDQARKDFPDGVLWAELGQHPNQQELISKLDDLTTRVTGEQSLVHNTVPGASEAFAGAIADRRILFVIDDVWREEDLEPFLAGGAHCVRLVTARHPPAALEQVTGDHWIQVNPMSTGEAWELALSGLSDSSTPEAHELLRQCGGSPLALALLRETLRSRIRRMTLQQAVGGLIDEFEHSGVGVLDELADTASRRLATTLKLSLSELEVTSPFRETSRRRFVQLAVFGKGWPIPYRSLERLWGLSAAQTFSECRRFLSRSLAVEADGQALRLHDVVHDQLRHWFHDEIRAAADMMLNAVRPAGGWHSLNHDAEIWPQLSYYLLQAERATELSALLRDLRFLVARLRHGGSVLLGHDVRTNLSVRPEDPYLTALLGFLSGEGWILDHASQAGLGEEDLPLTLHTRMLGYQEVSGEVTHVGDVLPGKGLVAYASPPGITDPRLLAVLTGCTGGCSLTWLPDGRLASIDQDSLRVWNIESGAPEPEVVLSFFADPTTDTSDNGVVQGQVSPDGRHLALIGETIVFLSDEEVDITAWVAIIDIATGAYLAKRSDLTPFWEEGPRDIAWGPDSTVAYSDGKTVRLWSPFGMGEPATKVPALVAGEEDESVVAVAWHPTAGLACTTDGHRLVLYPDPTTGTWESAMDQAVFLDLTQFLDPEAMNRRWLPHVLAWRPDGRRLAVALESPGGDGQLLIIDPIRRRVVEQISAPDIAGRPREISWRSDGRALACIWAQDRLTATTTVWQEQPVNAAPKHFTVYECLSVLYSVAWSMAGDCLALATVAGTIRLYHPMPTPMVRPLRFAARKVRWQPHGPLLAINSGNLSVIVNAEAPDRIVRVVPDDGVWSPDGRSFATCDRWARAIVIIDVETGEILRELATEHNDISYRLLDWPTPRYLLIEVDNSNVKLIDINTGHVEIDALPITAGSRLTEVAASPNGTRLAISRHLGGLKVVDMKAADTTFDCAGRYGVVRFSSGGDHLVAAVEDGLTLWDIKSGNLLERRKWDFPRQIAVDISGRYVAAVGSGLLYGHVALFDARSLEMVCHFWVDGTTEACDFDSTGERLAIAGSKGLHLFKIRP